MRNLSLFNIPKRAIKTKLPKRRIPISKEELELKKELMKTKQKVFGGVYAQKFNVPQDKINVFQLDQNEEYHSLLNNLYFFKYNEYNIGYILHESKTKSLLLFDNGNYDVSKDAVSRVQEIIGEQVQPELIFTTHHHADVSRGNTDWKRNLPNIEIFSGNYKGTHAPGATIMLDELDKVNIGDMEIQCMYTPGHTEDHVSYLVFNKQETGNKTPLIFCGNAAFNAGCGALYSKMHFSLYLSFLKIMSMPGHSRLLPSCDYTVDNLRFALTEFPENGKILTELNKAIEKEKAGIPNIGYTIRKERTINPYVLIQTMIKKETGLKKEFEERAYDFSKLRMKRDKLI